MPNSSSMPGIERSSSASTSSRSSHVPCSRTSPSARGFAASQRANARGASSSTASTPPDARRGDADSRTPSASPSECAGSVETRRTRPERRRGAARADASRRRAESAKAQAQVVLPTPPLPAKKTKRGVDGERPRLPLFVRLEALDVDAGDLVLGRHRESALLRALDLADSGEHVALDPGELLLGDLAELELHLRLEQLIAQRRVVVHLGFGGGDHLVEDEPQAADQDRVQDEHVSADG